MFSSRSARSFNEGQRELVCCVVLYQFLCTGDSRRAEYASDDERVGVQLKECCKSSVNRAFGGGFEDPNSQFTELPWDYLHPNHAGYTAMGEAINLSFFAPHHR